MLHLKSCYFSLLSVLGFSGLFPATVHSEVVTSVKPLAFIAAAIADGVTPVSVVLPDGASEHEYALRPSEIKRIKNAELVIWVGPEMEAFMTRAVAGLPAGKSMQLAALPAVTPLLIKGDDDDHDHGLHHDEHVSSATENSDVHHSHGEYNMHIWMSPQIAEASAIAIHDKLLELIPNRKDQLDANLELFKAGLAQTDKQIRARLAPVAHEGYFVFHDAYGYFENYFGLSPLGHFTVNPEIQPGAQRLHQIRTQLVEQKAVCVFAEPQFRPAVIDAVARGTSVRKGTLDPLGMNISVTRESYVQFLSQLSVQYTSCLKGA
ncbi:zinc ABC transporter substrate-binding protein ZnuA [Tatumella citrea]|uniref:High-affinity zinc uptake system protein ZnuA n=1 Tax=Tatumella citrea TaxID=53336 RepID=A0A1Y0L8E1_TATCI|nr:zinc ABC transporter substrate-binding protein ZnuA [Tatumella citrea]ARU94207.1 zinc ABC transporter substrate-binding protein [Tatumella citrea]ARU98247.1 zinc ABC transporter substrate-binding protein [Tatumella citrea]